MKRNFCAVNLSMKAKVEHWCTPLKNTVEDFCLCSTDDSIGITDDCLGSTDDSIGITDDCLGSTDDSIGNTDDCLGSTDDSIDNTDDCLGSTDDSIGITDDCLGSTDDSIGITDDCLGSTDDSIGITDDCLGSTDDSIGITDDCLGSTDDSIGITDDCLGSTDDCLGITDDCLGITDDCLGITDDCLGITDDCLGITDDCLGITDDSIGITDDCLGSTDDSIGITDDCLGSTDDSIGITDDCLGSTDDSIDITDDCLGSADDSIGITDDCLGSADDSIGITDDCLGSTDDSIGITDDCLEGRPGHSVKAMEPLSAVILDGALSSTHSSRVPTKSLSMLQMLLLNAVVGVEIVACAGFTYIPPLLLKAGYSEENMGFLLGMGPLFGFLLVPIIGRASDRCYSQFGRRRPFIVGLAVMMVLSLYLIPFGEYFATLVVGVSSLSKRIGLISLTVGVVLLDFTTQSSLTPCEALLNDASKDTEQNEKIFTVYSLMISSGGILGYALTAIDWTSTPLGEYFGGQEATIFSVLIIVFTSMLAATLVVAKEVPLSVTPVDISTLSSSNHHAPQKLMLAHESGYESSGNASEDGLIFGEQGLLRSSRARSRSERLGLLLRPFKRVCTQLTNYFLSKSRFLNSVFVCLCWLGRQLLPQQLVQLFKVPLVLRMLALADYCAWTAIMGFNIYYTDYVGQIVYGGNPNAPPMSHEGRAYDEGVRVASWGLLLHCICSAAFSFFIERLTAAYGYKTTFTLGMVSFVFSMMGMVLIRHIYFVNLMAAATGFAYSTITTIPFMLVSKYHADKKLYFADLPPALLSDTERGIGSDIAVLDWSYFLSQVVMTAAMGTIVHITGTIVSYMVTAGAMGILSIYYIGNIIENEQQARRFVSKYNQHIRNL
ncbi:hypothetical protein Btru_006319 [Bulinus truncatus]|nr:hypothetical protein Btru_006319 [Bulinus truncatus]